MLFPKPVGPTDVQVNFSPEQVIGARVDARPPRLGKSSYAVVAPDVQLFPYESTYGWHIEARLPKFDRRGWVTPETKFDPAPFSVEMFVGARVDARPPFAAKQSWSVREPDIQPFPFESTFGWRIEPRLPKMDRRGFVTPETNFDAAPFSPEMVVGARNPVVPAKRGLGLFSWMLPDSIIFSGISITVRNFQGNTSTQTVSSVPFLYVVGPPQFTIQNWTSTVGSIVLSGSHQGLYIREREASISADGNVWFRWEEDQPVIGIAPTAFRPGVF